MGWGDTPNPPFSVRPTAACSPGCDLPEPGSPPAGARVRPRKIARTTDARTTRTIKGRPIGLPDAPFERFPVGAHRRDRTISVYVDGILDGQVPDHRVVRADAPDPDA